jgi:hypothetical protein
MPAIRGLKNKAGGTWTSALYESLHEDFKVVEGYYLVRVRSTRGAVTPMGVRVGSMMSNGYRQLSWKGFLEHDLCRTQYEHRIIYFMTYRELPEQIDHIDGVRDNNHVLNLRASNNRDNQMNRHKKAGTKNLDLPIGVCRVERSGREGVWYAIKMEYNGDVRGTYRRDKDDAIQLIKEWREEHAKKTITQ